MKAFLIIIVTILASLPYLAYAQTSAYESKEKMAITMYGHRYAVTKLVQEDSSLTWKDIYPYIPKEFFAQKNPDIEPEKLKTIITQKRQALIKDYNDAFNSLSAKFKNDDPEARELSTFDLELAGVFNANLSEGLALKYPQYKDDILETDKLNKEVIALQFLEDIITQNILIREKIKNRTVE